jgi:uncharacterized membrane protein YeaQ/YmgE (transglycosylase-associated protein family)
LLVVISAALAYSRPLMRRQRAGAATRKGRAMQYVWMVIVGFVVGLLARALLPGDQKLGLIMTAVLGIVGSFVAGFIGQAVGWYQAGQGAGFIGSVVGAIIVLLVYTKLVNKPAPPAQGPPAA